MFLRDTFEKGFRRCSIKFKSFRGGDDTDVAALDDTESTPLNKGQEYDITDSTHSKRSLTAEYYSYERSTDALLLCGLLFLGYLLMGIFAFSWVFEEWPVVYSCYFSVVTFTTIGYGDLHPTSPGGKVFTIVFTLYGVGILGFFLGIIGQDIFEAQRDALEEAKVRSQKRIMHMFSKGDHEFSDDDTHHPGRAFYMPPKVKPLWDEVTEIMLLEAPMIACIAVVTIIIGRLEGWSIIDSAYYCVISLTTVGYGDVHPDTQVTMLVSIFYLPLAVAIFGEILYRIASAYINRKARKMEEDFLNRELTMSDLRMMDENFDDKVELWEFLSFMLVAMQKVDKQSIDELKVLFHSLDVTGSGCLDKGDLLLAARRKKERILGQEYFRSMHTRSYTAPM